MFCVCCNNATEIDLPTFGVAVEQRSIMQSRHFKSRLMFNFRRSVQTHWSIAVGQVRGWPLIVWAPISKAPLSRNDTNVLLIADGYGESGELPHCDTLILQETKEMMRLSIFFAFATFNIMCVQNLQYITEYKIVYKLSQSKNYNKMLIKNPTQ